MTTDYYPGHSSLGPSDPEKTPPPIFIVTNIDYDGWHTTHISNVSYGYFTSEHAAKEFVDNLNRRDREYRYYVNKAEAERAKYEAAYAEQKARWEELSSKIDNPEDFMEEPRYTNVPSVKTYEQWRIGKPDEYGYEEVDFCA